MKVIEIRKMAVDELIKTSNELRAEIVDARKRVHLGETTNNRVIRKKRKDLARVLTVMREQLAKENV
ncbi:MAG: 50S ribosomal protein L29 [Patescibacteria group bacterium]